MSKGYIVKLNRVMSNDALWEEQKRILEDLDRTGIVVLNGDCEVIEVDLQLDKTKTRVISSEIGIGDSSETFFNDL